jgi:hypothetical protein
MCDLKIFACGDVVIGKERECFISDDLKDIISSADISICNFEAPIESSGKPILKVGNSIFQLKMAPKLLKEAGFNVLSLANNHIYDYGEEGLFKTIESIEKEGLVHVGAGMNFEDTYKMKIVEKNKVKFGFLSFCEAEFGCLLEDECRGGYAWVNHHNIDNLIKKSKREVDVLIVNAHAGPEEVPVPLPEWRQRYRALCDYGADIIIGHHPHVPQGYERYKDSMIFYSLGNFYFNLGTSDVTENSYSVLLEYKGKNLSGYKIIPHRQESFKTAMFNDDKFNMYLVKLNNLLEKDYVNLVNEQVVYLYKNRYEGYYKESVGLFKRQWRQLFLLHNIRIESHMWVVRRALSLLTEKNFVDTPDLMESLLKEYLLIGK